MSKVHARKEAKIEQNLDAQAKAHKEFNRWLRNQRHSDNTFSKAGDIYYLEDLVRQAAGKDAFKGGVSPKKIVERMDMDLTGLFPHQTRQEHYALLTRLTKIAEDARHGQVVPTVR